MEKVQKIIANVHDVAYINGLLTAHHESAVQEGKPLRVIIDQKKPDRTLAQNRLYWKWVEQISNHTGIDKEEVHIDLKYRFLVSIYFNDYEDIAEQVLIIREFKSNTTDMRFSEFERNEFARYYQKLSRIFLENHVSTTRATVEQFTEYLKKIDLYAHSQLGVMLIIPHEYRWVYERYEPMQQ